MYTKDMLLSIAHCYEQFMKAIINAAAYKTQNFQINSHESFGF